MTQHETEQQCAIRTRPSQRAMSVNSLAKLKGFGRHRGAYDAEHPGRRRESYYSTSDYCTEGQD
jgi:hypothetical protein